MEKNPLRGKLWNATGENRSDTDLAATEKREKSDPKIGSSEYNLNRCSFDGSIDGAVRAERRERWERAGLKGDDLTEE